MRPLRLRIENLTAFRGEHPALELGSYELFAISGPTGSGKTSLLDAMLIALYGEVPRTGSSLKDLISQGRDRMSVRLDFAVGSAEYRVTRAIYANTRPTQAILERLVPGGEPMPVVDGVTAVEKEIQTLLGLNYDAFTQAVILPQGRFDQFLRSKPRERNDILKELLRLQVYERMRERAESDAKAADVEVKILTQTLKSTYGDATKEALGEIERQHAETHKANGVLTKRVATLADDVESLRGRFERVRGLSEARKLVASLEVTRMSIEKNEVRLGVARRAAVVVPQLESADRARVEADKAKTLVAQAEGDARQVRELHEMAKTRFAVAQKAANRVPDLEVQIESLGRAVALAEPITAARTRADQARKREHQLAADVKVAVDSAAKAENKHRLAQQATKAREATQEKALTKLGEAERWLEASKEAHTAGLRADAVAHLRHGLKPKDPCPVCERPLDSTPRKIPGSGQARLAEALEAAEESVRRSRTAHENSRGQTEEARRAEVLALAEVKAAVDRVAATTSNRDQATADLKGAVDDLAARETQLRQLTLEPDPSKAQAKLKAEKEGLSKELSDAQSHQATLAAKLAGAVAAVDTAARRTTDAVAAAEKEEKLAEKSLSGAGFESARAARDGRLSESEQTTIVSAVERWKQQHHSASEQIRILEGALDKQDKSSEAFQQLEGQFNEAEVQLRDCRKERDSGLQAESRLDQKRREMAERLAQADKVWKALDEARARVGPLRQLALDLRSNAFQAYLLEETFRDLVAGASVRLFKLSSRYTFEYEKDAFLVVDHDNAAERRPAETLSGGETFLASLALALELSQQVQRSAGAVDIGSLFVDEGFGTLDAEALDVVADAIESLPTAGRMVGIITHLPELTARLPACILVEKGADGSRIKLRAA